MKRIRYLCEAIPVWAMYLVFRFMKTENASNLGGWIGRTVGPRIGASKKALKNLQIALPGKTPEEYAAIIQDMWDNLGRIAAEYPHLDDIVFNYCDIIGQDHIESIGKDKPAVIIGAHQANWELSPYYLNNKLDWPTSCIFRRPNNPYVEKLLAAWRNPEKRGTYIPKSKQGARDIVRTLRRGERLAILIDQKYNQGIPAEFFGRPAMTSTAFAQLAKNYDCPIVPFQVVRTKGCRSQIIIHPPFYAEGRSEEDIVRHAHAMLEGWIMQHPGQWLWLHRRWDSRAVKELT